MGDLLAAVEEMEFPESRKRTVKVQGKGGEFEIEILPYDSRELRRHIRTQSEMRQKLVASGHVVQLPGKQPKDVSPHPDDIADATMLECRVEPKMSWLHWLKLAETDADLWNQVIAEVNQMDGGSLGSLEAAKNASGAGESADMTAGNTPTSAGSASA